ncbi:hypothetical protein CRUP_001057 [Coryphaenoides rupestris]|nr:hypothetical protein CRUP_001057 [Coryphaenoides rupestris]
MDRGFEGVDTPEGVRVSLTGKTVLESQLTTVFLPIVYIIVFVVGLPANGLALWVFLFRTKKKNPSSIFMANLALCDLLFIVWIPLKIAYHLNGNNWIYGEGLCKVLVAFFYANMYCSIGFIACISVQRYWAIVHPLSRTGRRGNGARVAVGVSAAIWLSVWTLTAPLYLYEQTVKLSNVPITTCHDVTRPDQRQMAAGYFLTMGVVGFLAPAAVCVVAYVRMLKTLRSSMTDEAIAQKRRKAVVLIVTVLVMFLVCFAPSNVMLLVHYSLLLAARTNNGYGFYVVTLCLASLNSCVDPFVYYFISEDFREHVRNKSRYLPGQAGTARRIPRVVSAPLKVGIGRGFRGFVDPTDSERVLVDEATSAALTSGLTTVFLPVVYIFVFAVALPTNAMAIWVFAFRTKKQHPSSIYMANLALSDLLFVVWLPFKVAYHLKGNDWTYGEPMCKVFVGFFYGNMYCSVLFIAALSVQRYWVVAHPLSQQRRNNKMAVVACACIWAFYPYYYFMFSALVVFLVPCVLIVVAYVLLLRTLRVSRSTDSNDTGKKQRRAVMLIATVLVTFLLCFVPSNVMLVVHYSLLKDGEVDNLYGFYVATLCLSSLNSCLDPFIYYFVSEDFREHVRNTLLCRSTRAVARLRSSFSSMKYSRKSKAYVSNSGNTQSSSC